MKGFEGTRLPGVLKGDDGDLLDVGDSKLHRSSKLLVARDIDSFKGGAPLSGTCLERDLTLVSKGAVFLTLGRM